MPLYTVTTPEGLLSAQQRDVIAAELVRIHMAAMNVPVVGTHAGWQEHPNGRLFDFLIQSSSNSVKISSHGCA